MNDIENNKSPMALFIDLSKAFDTIDHTILIEKLRIYGVLNNRLRWFQSYLSDRQQFVEINGVSSNTLPIRTGVPQGSILGPLLFIIYMNDVSSSTNFFHFIIYADDTNLISSITTPGASLRRYSAVTNWELDKIRVWLAVNKLSLNVLKTKFLVFRTKNKHIDLESIKLNIDGKPIQRVSNFDFLGLVINESLSWKPHTNKIASF